MRAAPIPAVDDGNAFHLVAIIFGVRPSDTNSNLRILIRKGKVLREVARSTAIRVLGRIVRIARAEQNRRAVAPIHSVRQYAPTRAATGLDRDRGPAGRSLKRYALTLDAIVRGAGVLRHPRPDHGERHDPDKRHSVRPPHSRRMTPPHATLLPCA